MDKSNFYYHGSPKHLNHYFTPNIRFKKLQISSLFKLRSCDVLVTSRAWSILFELLCLLPTSHRPYLIQLADGLIFSRNQYKPKNRRYLGLYNKILADKLIVRQNPRTIKSSDSNYINTTHFNKTKKSPLQYSKHTVYLVAGTDAILGHIHEKVVDAFSESAQKLQRAGVQKIYLSCPSKRLERAITRQAPFVVTVGKMSSEKWDNKTTLCIGSPSTVLYDNQWSNGCSLILDIYADNDMSNFFSCETVISDHLSNAPSFAIEAIQLTAKSILKIADPDDLKPTKRRIRLSFYDFLKNFSFKFAFVELLQLISGEDHNTSAHSNTHGF